MKLRKLEEHLQDAKVFRNPSIKLEQYPTSPHIAAHMLFTINSAFDEIDGKVIADLGCGCGILGIGAEILGSGQTFGFDIDPAALHIAWKNNKNFETDVNFVLCDVTSLCADRTVEEEEDDEDEGNEEEDEEEEEKEKEVQEEKPNKGTPMPSRWIKAVDTVIMNPPFGTKVKGIDMVFLETAIKMARVSVYSLHKTSTRSHITRKAKQWGVNAQVLAQLRWDIPAMHKFHKKQSVDIEVDFWRFEIQKK